MVHCLTHAADHRMPVHSKHVTATITIVWDHPRSDGPEKMVVCASGNIERDRKHTQKT
jgi:hypothetical protein